MCPRKATQKKAEIFSKCPNRKLELVERKPSLQIEISTCKHKLQNDCYLRAGKFNVEELLKGKEVSTTWTSVMKNFSVWLAVFDQGSSRYKPVTTCNLGS
jgi:hypothetical protein